MKLSFNEADPKLLGEMLKMLRKNHGYSQTVVADYLGIDRSTYTKYELGRTPDVTVIAKLSALYNITSDSILSVYFKDSENSSSVATLSSTDRENAIYLLTKEEQALIDYYRNSLRKDAILDFTQNVYLEDCEETED